MIQRMLLDTYLAIPYRHHGRSDQGIDCWGMLKRYYKDHFDIDIPAFSLDSVHAPRTIN